MATITSTQNGNYNIGSTWVGGVAPGVNDGAVVLHDVTITGNKSFAKTVTVRTNGELILNNILEFTDSAGAGLTIEDDGNFSTNGTAAVPRTIQSAGGDSPTNKWAIAVEDYVGADTRTLDFTYVEFVGGKPRLGNDVGYIEFNTGLATSPILGPVTPPAPLPRLVEHDIPGRDAGRLYRRGRSARVMTISGTCRLDSYLFQQLDDMEKAGLRISLFTRHHHLPKCRLENVTAGPSYGVYVAFSITVREDV